MTRRWPRGCLGVAAMVGVCAVLLACGEASDMPAAAKRGRLANGLVADVGGQLVRAEWVAAVASRQGVTLARARDAAVYDALFAAAADGALGERARLDAERRALARVMLRSIHEQTAQAPISDEELKAATAARWLSVARPVGYRTVHALARVKPEDDEAAHRAARALAERMRQAVLPISSAAAATPPPHYDPQRMFENIHVAAIDPLANRFIEAAKKVPAEAKRVLMQPLQVVAADGRVLDTTSTGGKYDREFVAAIVTLGHRGELTDVVKTKFGYHVIMLLEVTPARQLGREARLKELREELLRVRGVRAYQAQLKALRKKSPVTVVSNADALLTLVPVSR